MKVLLVALLALVAVAAAENLPECPDVGSSDEAVQVPNPDDCGSFYKCDGDGIPILVPCPPGLEYNPELKVCDYPSDAGCSSRKAH